MTATLYRATDRHVLRIGRLEKHQNPSEIPSRHISKSRAERFIVRKIAKWVVFGKILQMLEDDAVIRGDAQYFRARVEIIPAKRKRWKQNLLLWYPHKSQASQRPGAKRTFHPQADRASEVATCNG